MRIAFVINSLEGGGAARVLSILLGRQLTVFVLNNKMCTFIDNLQGLHDPHANIRITRPD
jgi:hypothetical protein